MNDNVSLIVTIAAVAAAVFLPAVWVSTHIDAALPSIVRAWVQTIVTVGIAGATWYYLVRSGSGTLCITFFAAGIIWWCWWPVLDSIAMGGAPLSAMPDFARAAPWHDTWLNSGWVKWTPSLMLCAIASLFGYRAYARYC